MNLVLKHSILKIMILASFVFVIFASKLSAQDFPPGVSESGPFDVKVTKDIMVPMRDGVKLATDLYAPASSTGKLPTVIIRLPYIKDTYTTAVSAANYIASHGFNVAVQDMRGRGKSEGQFLVFGNERRDGYDFIDWIIRQPWSTDRVGSYGCSYLGENQILLAAEKHPNHKAMIAQAAGGAIGSLDDSYKYFAAYNGGVAKLASALGWMSRNGDIGMNDRSTNIPNKSQLLRQLPSIDLLRKAGLGPNYWDDFLKRSFTDPWWDKMGYTTDQDTFNTPAIHVDGWYDTGVSDTLRHFNRMRSHGMSVEARENQFAIISPGTHCRSEGLGKDAMVGDVNVGDASFPYWDTYLKWFDYWLKGKDNGVTDMPKVQYHVTRRETWANAEQWPPAASTRVKYFLRSGGKANSLNGDGVLSQTPPAQEPSDRFVYDPGNPVPSKGGSFCCTGNPDDRPGIFDQTEIERRDDVLVYTSAALDKPMTLTGPLEGVLHVSSTAKDTDFTLKLVDVQPDGKAYNIQESIIRARYRGGFDQQVFMKKGDVYRLTIDLNDTAYYLPAGHKLRLEVSSSNFPHFERNLNTGGRNYDETEWVKANNTVHHNSQYPSYIMVFVKE